MENTKIEWAHHTFNPWEGCQKVGPGCDHCYAETRNARFGGGEAVNWGPGAPRRRTSASNWQQPIKWNAEAERLGDRQRVFCASLADVFDNAVDPKWRADLFRLIRSTPNLDWLLLTKRIGNAKAMIDDARDADAKGPIWPWPNVWIGATIVNQEEAERDIPKLLAVPAAKRFLSMEPLLGPVDLTVYHDWLGRSEGGMWCPDCPEYGVGIDPKEHRQCLGEVEGVSGYDGIDWVIVGGESGPGARPMHPEWARNLRDQCEAAGVPFLFKQWGEWLPGQNDMHAIGRKVAHHQDGSWGPTETNPTSKNYVTWDANGCMHVGNLASTPLGFRVEVWAERVGKKAAGRMLDGRTWDGVPT